MRCLVIALFLAGCSSDYTERCKTIVNHTVEVGIRESTVGMTADDRDKFAHKVNSRREEAVEKCEDAKPSKEDEDCALAGQSLAEINSCTWYSKASMGAAR